MNADDDTAEGPGPGRTTGMPRWVKVILVIGILLVLALVVSRLLGVQHGPGLHGPPGGSGGHTSPMAQGAERP